MTTLALAVLAFICILAALVCSVGQKTRHLPPRWWWRP